MDNNQNGPNNGPGNRKGPKNGQTIIIFLIVTVITLIVMALFNSMMNGTTNQEITYNKFMEMLDNDEVESVVIESNQYVITPKQQPYGFSSLKGMKFTYYTGVVNDPNLSEKLLKAGVDFKKEIPDMSSELLYSILSFVLPLILIWVIMGFAMRRMGGGGGGVMGIGKNKARVYAQKETGVTFKDVAGQDEAKESLQEVVDFLENPGKYSNIGAKLPKGALLVGPPGTGKTLLAKAVAGEAHAPFFSLSGSEFVEMFVGVGASRVRELFEEAKKNAPCIIFIDEIDAIGKSRDSRFGGGNDEREQTLNQLLAEMDGFDSGSGLLILAATNRPEVLDQALLRPGRFDRRVVVDKPDLQGRIDVLKVHSKNVMMDETVDLEAIALATSGAVGSDLANMINEAAILAVKKGRNAVSQQDLFESVEVVLVGKEKKNKILSKEERRIVSYHEVGHALVSALQKDSEPVQKITIVPRTMGALGYVMNVPEEEKYLNTKAEIQARIVECVGGRAAEEIVFNSITTGAANDIEQATKMARAMITQYGMSDKFGMVGLESPENQYLSGRNVLNCSDQTATEIDREVMKIIKEAYEEALKLLRSHRKALDEIAAFLIEKETITGKEFMEIFHEVERREEEEVEEAEQTDVSENVDEKVEAAEQQTEAQDDGVDAVKDQSAEPTEHTETEITGEEAQQ
ncbi:ATP-dependent zinc metalloprotease FtsH [uncultured Clostridium sp.]|uniref:ATP-dependent zinc metalloprotease FtsH n=1 Tax=Muricoprocola aceti TaxID=2981772 RepID=A0ABT2SL77_9FIRM|nr:ATP-dependent zinc metalloprotease FtsH [Muricoprocola aceti]MCU6725055.1 ATP-dependent zinc metalloprotease FtsH [Muricoprocola aceti]SCH36780.1 ATP-dependent zinc metalloprotease FtsH [uncultured Clostridium sp.]